MPKRWELGEPAETEVLNGRTELEERIRLVADGLVPVHEAAELLGIKRSKMYQMMDQGELAYVKIGGARRIPKRAVLEYAARHLRGGVRA